MKWLIALMICKGLIIVSTQAGIHIKDGLIGIKPGEHRIRINTQGIKPLVIAVMILL